MLMKKSVQSSRQQNAVRFSSNVAQAFRLSPPRPGDQGRPASSYFLKMALLPKKCEFISWLFSAKSRNAAPTMKVHVQAGGDPQQSR